MAAQRVVLWFRNDLRLMDNAIIAEATKRMQSNRQLQEITLECTAGTACLIPAFSAASCAARSGRLSPCTASTRAPSGPRRCVHRRVRERRLDQHSCIGAATAPLSRHRCRRAFDRSPAHPQYGPRKSGARRARFLCESVANLQAPPPDPSPPTALAPHGSPARPC